MWIGQALGKRLAFPQNIVGRQMKRLLSAPLEQQLINKSVRVTINSKPVIVSEGSSLLDAAKAAGVFVPTLCYHPRFKASAVCRLCLVEVEGQSTLLPACATVAKDGDVIRTDSEDLVKYRRLDTQFLLSRHPNDCMRCEVQGRCKLQRIVQTEQLEEIWPKSERGNPEKHPEHSLHDHTSPAITRDIDKCIECGLCVNACGGEIMGQNQNVIGFVERGKNMLPVTVFDKPLADTKCISCGQCTVVCPVGALTERADWHKVMHVLSSGRRRTAVQVAPATRVAIGEEFGFPPGSVNTGRMINALRALGFDYVFDTNFTADLTIMEEATELLMRVDLQAEAKAAADALAAAEAITDDDDNDEQSFPDHTGSRRNSVSSGSSNSGNNSIEELRKQADKLSAQVANKPLPQFTSCCPGWVNWLEINRPDLLRNLSTTKSPQQMLGAVIKRGIFPYSDELNSPRTFPGGGTCAAGSEAAGRGAVDCKSNGIDKTHGNGNDKSRSTPSTGGMGSFASGENEVYVVSVMPCTAKKDEAVRPTVAGDVDAVITTRELAQMIRARGIAFASLPNEAADMSTFFDSAGISDIDAKGGDVDGDGGAAGSRKQCGFDSPLGESTGAAVIFGASGGVMEAALRTAVFVLSQRQKQQKEQEGKGKSGKKEDEEEKEEELPMDFHSLRSSIPGVKEASIPGLGSVAVCNGIASAQKLLESEEWRRYLAIEVMSCIGGCLNGGGEPKSDVKDVVQRRAASIYSIDKGQKKRRSHENKQVQRLYEDLLDHPLSHKSEMLLHTTFAARHSDRELLGRFLAAVDRRDGAAAAALFADAEDVHAHNSSRASSSSEGEDEKAYNSCMWQTNTLIFGDVIGKAAIQQLIERQLPPNKKGPHMMRHRLEDAAAGTVVHTPAGETVRFEMETVGQGSAKRIKRLARVLISA